MKRRLLWLGALAFVGALLTALPAHWVAALLPKDVRCAEWRGTVWNGECADGTLEFSGTPVRLQSLQWRVNPRAWWHLAAGMHVTVHSDALAVQVYVERGVGERMTMNDLQAQGQIDHGLLPALPQDWHGQFSVEDGALRLSRNQLQALGGVFRVMNMADAAGNSLGSYRLDFAVPQGAADIATAGAPFIGQLTDSGGPIAVNARVTVQADRNWELNGTVAARDMGNVALGRQLDLVGSPDASGNRPLSAAGMF